MQDSHLAILPTDQSQEDRVLVDQDPLNMGVHVSSLSGLKGNNGIGKKRRAMKQAITDAGSVKKVKELINASYDMAMDKELPGTIRTASIKICLEYWAGIPDPAVHGEDTKGFPRFEFEDTGDSIVITKTKMKIQIQKKNSQAIHRTTRKAV